VISIIWSKERVVDRDEEIDPTTDFDRHEETFRAPFFTEKKRGRATLSEAGFLRKQC